MLNGTCNGNVLGAGVVDTHVHRLWTTRKGWLRSENASFTSKVMFSAVRPRLPLYSNIELFIDAFYYHHLWVHILTTRLTANWTNARMNTSKMLFDCWVPAPVNGSNDDGWRSSHLKLNAQMAVHIINFAPQTTNLFAIWIGKSIFLRRLTLTWLLDGTWTWTPSPIERWFFNLLICLRVVRSTESSHVCRWFDGWKMHVISFSSLLIRDKGRSTGESSFRCFTQQKQKCQSRGILVIDK